MEDDKALKSAPPQATVSSPEPSWKSTLLSLPSISRRAGIARGYSPAYENTDTLVLTGTSGLFVDIRFSLKGDGWVKDEGFWAFGGRARTTFPGDQHADLGFAKNAAVMPYLCHCEWEHIIDSDGTSDDKDEGDMLLLPNGECFEYGVDDNGKVYKEYWVSVTDTDKTACRVALCQTDPGILIRIGKYCQGIAQVLHSEEPLAKTVYVGRWVLEEGTWQEDRRNYRTEPGIGETVFPLDWFLAQDRKKNDSKPNGQGIWTIVEAEA